MAGIPPPPQHTHSGIFVRSFFFAWASASMRVRERDLHYHPVVQCSQDLAHVVEMIRK